MGKIRDAGNSAWRDYETEGLPATGIHKPTKAEIRGTYGVVEDVMSAVQLAGAVELKYATKALMDADTGQADGAIALVFLDSTEANNGYYVWDDGGGEWTDWAGLNPSEATAAALSAIEAREAEALAALGYSSEAPPVGIAEGLIDDAGRLGPSTDDDGAFRAAAAEFGAINGVGGPQVKVAAQAILDSYWSRRAPYHKPADIVVVLKSGQSPHEGGESNFPLIDNDPEDGVLMIDAIRNRFLSSGARFLNGFQPAVEVLELVGGSWFGQTGMKACGSTIIQRINEEHGTEWKFHKTYVLVLCIGESGNAVSEIEYGTPAFTLAQDTCQAIADEVADVASDWYGLTVKCAGLIWNWGKNGYDNSLSAATAKSQQLAYFNNVRNYLAPTFGQRPDEMRVGIVLTSGHVPGAKRPNTIAESQHQMAEEEDWIDEINPQGGHQLEYSSTHHKPSEACKLDIEAGLWVYETFFAKRRWTNWMPTLERVSNKVFKLDFSGSLLPHHSLRLETTTSASGTDKTMVTGYGVQLFNQAAPTTALTLLRRPWFDGAAVYAELASDPGAATIDVRYSAGTQHGNIVQRPDIPELEITRLVDGETFAVRRRPGPFDRPAPAYVP